MGVDPKRPLVGFALVALLCAVLMVLSVGRGVGSGVFGPGRPLVAPAVVDQQDLAPEPVAAPATVTIPAELSAQPLGAAPAGPLPTRDPSPAPEPTAEPVAEDPVGVLVAGVEESVEEVEVAPTDDTSAERRDARADRKAERREARADRKAERREARAERKTQREQARADRKADRDAAKAARDAAKAERKADRDAAKAERKAARDAAKAARDAERDAAKAARDEAKAARKG